MKSIKRNICVLFVLSFLALSVTAQIEKDKIITCAEQNSVILDKARKTFGKVKVLLIGKVFEQTFINNDKENITLTQSVAMAGGLSKNAAQGQIFVLRNSKKNNSETLREILLVNLKNIGNGDAPDIKLQKDDIVFVPQNCSGKTFKTFPWTDKPGITPQEITR